MAGTEIRSTGLSEIEAPSSVAEVADAADLEGLSDKPKSFGRLAWERFLNHRLALVGAVGLVVIVLLFFLAPYFSDYGVADRNVRDRLLGPSWDHPFGTDEIGRDLFVRTAAGGRYSLQIGLFAAVISTMIGTLLGAVSGYFGRWVDVVVSQLVNLLLIVPALIILSVFALRFGGTAISLALILAGLLWTRIARVVRGVVLAIKEQEYIMAARAAGASHWRIIFRHLLPNVMGAIAVEVTLLLGTVIVLESTLSFLGLGVKPPNTSLGTLVRDAKGSIDSDPLRVLMPGIWIVLIVLCVNFLGDGLRDALDPRSKAEGNKPVKAESTEANVTQEQVGP
ncbi:ABC transporter permease [Ilumatobacter coccineus]|jgi:glutathione transport system permease protein|uniref:Oligopeptide ABC transporter permease protein n=1 Tax=Ilumatobacter coccineus (strain NBRC 103263 / KCTC 29153 / YM16-304) TaxID=1313172 RepID=A0A6C7EES9_ILUCY|nr:ABC transporter permease [Ilumatobacter coccineus]BAN02486.1 oligopeptide ABC transporter permease protein [Ilumatobacter coccineus YM16-304]